MNIDLSAERKKKLDELLSSDILKFSLSESFSEAVKNCVLKFETDSKANKNTFRLVAAEEQYFETARDECAKIVFEFVQYEVSFSFECNSIVFFLFTTSKIAP